LSLKYLISSKFEPKIFIGKTMFIVLPDVFENF